MRWWWGLVGSGPILHLLNDIVVPIQAQSLTEAHFIAKPHPLALGNGNRVRLQPTNVLSKKRHKVRALLKNRGEWAGMACNGCWLAQRRTSLQQSPARGPARSGAELSEMAGTRRPQRDTAGPREEPERDTTCGCDASVGEQLNHWPMKRGILKEHC